MSNSSNERLIEHAQTVAEEWAGTLVADAILFNLERGDLEKVQYLVAQAEHESAIQHFHNYDLLPKEAEDVY